MTLEKLFGRNNIILPFFSDPVTTVFIYIDSLTLILFFFFQKSISPFYNEWMQDLSVCRYVRYDPLMCFRFQLTFTSLLCKKLNYTPFKFCLFWSIYFSKLPFWHITSPSLPCSLQEYTWGSHADWDTLVGDILLQKPEIYQKHTQSENQTKAASQSTTLCLHCVWAVLHFVFSLERPL